MPLATRRWALLTLAIALCSTSASCSEEKSKPKVEESAAFTPEDYEMPVSQAKYACGLFPHSWASELTDTPIAELYQPRFRAAELLVDGQARLSVDHFHCSIGKPSDRPFMHEDTLDAILSFSVIPVDFLATSSGDFDAKFRSDLMQSPYKTVLPPGMGRGYFLDRKGAYMSYSCTEKRGDIYVILEYYADYEKTRFEHALPFLRLMDAEIKRQLDCV
ncbi:MAG: hypothetical protein ACRC0L_08050 [Angustibacter sp.]